MLQSCIRVFTGRTIVSGGRPLATVAKGINPPPEVAEHGGRTPVDQSARDEESGERSEAVEKGDFENKKEEKKNKEVENGTGLKPNNPGLQSGG